MKNFLGLALEKIANRLVKHQEKVNEYNKLFEERDYGKKISRLKERLTEEYKLWAMKTKYVDRLRNVEKDIDSVKFIQNKKHLNQIDRDNIDRLMKKYNL